MRRTAIVVPLLLLVALPGCGGGSSKPKAAPSGSTTVAPGGSGGTTTTVVSSTTPVPDPCTLLSSSDVSAAIGTAAEGKPMAASTPNTEGPVRVGCTWGEVAGDTGVIGVQLSNAGGSGIDPLTALVNSTGATTPIDIGTNGKLLSRALIPYGGGVGQSIAFEADGNTVVVGLVRGTQAQLEAAARTVAANLS